MRVFRALVVWLTCLPAMVLLAGAVLVVVLSSRIGDPVDLVATAQEEGTFAAVLDAGLGQLSDMYEARGLTPSDAQAVVEVLREAVEVEWLAAQAELVASAMMEGRPAQIDLNPVLDRLRADPDVDLVVVAQMVGSEDAEGIELESYDLADLRVRYERELEMAEAEMFAELPTEIEIPADQGTFSTLRRLLSALSSYARLAVLAAVAVAAFHVAAATEGLRAVARLAIGSGILVLGILGALRYVAIPLASAALGGIGSVSAVLTDVFQIGLGPARWAAGVSIGVGIALRAADLAVRDRRQRSLDPSFLEERVLVASS